MPASVVLAYFADQMHVRSVAIARILEAALLKGTPCESIRAKHEAVSKYVE
jgi:hypothetical protein